MPELSSADAAGPGPQRALAGLKVLELGEMVAAPYCAKLLADLGAEVIKIEAPGVGDPARLRGPFPDDAPHPERSALFLYLNTSKRSVTLDLETEAGRHIFRQLLEGVDVLVEDRAPGVLEALGLGYLDLAAEHPRLIVTSITPFGQTGPHSQHKSQHLNLYHSGGHASPFHAVGPELARAPARAGGYLGEYDAGLTAALGTLAAVLGRELSGCGEHVDVSKQEALMCLERVTIGRFANEPEPFAGRPPGGLIRAKDGYIMLTTLEQHQWEGLVRAMGKPAWAEAEWFKDPKQRQERAAEINEHVAAWTASLSRDEIYRRVQEEGTPAGPVRNVAEVLGWGQARERGFFRELTHAEAGTLVYPTTAAKFSETPWVGGAAPLMGEHNHEVYCDGLGLEPEDLERLRTAGAV